MSDTAWRDQKTANAQHLDAELQRRRAKESAQARELIAQYLPKLQSHGPAAVPLTARAYSGSTTYRTGLTGWYLKQNRSVAIDTAGNFYVLSTQGSLRERFTGVTITPSDPPLVLGLGGRDGESLDLREALDRVVNSTHSG
ncbi:hypothetical protein [Jonesia quinghaiensis]|uniref:hypothetical protein n=1 Tax=Jonesia quinghaiensis TaxID=262806 RepID=UPI0003FC3E68|nr:hypothetical protein [Jonesia quinghaiensis]